MEYYSDIKNDEILLFVTTWMDLESTMLSEIRWKRTRAILLHSQVGYETEINVQVINTENRRVATKGD